MLTPQTSSLFLPSQNPRTGITSYLVKAQAPVQQSFYYTSPSFTNDGRYLWINCGFPPAGGMHYTQVLGVVDFEKDEFRLHLEMQSTLGRPMVDLENGDVYWPSQKDIWKRGPGADDKPIKINTFPADLAEGLMTQLATHMTFSADRTSVNIDAIVHRPDGRRHSILGDMPLDGSPFRHWQTIEGMYFDHGMFSPTDPDVQLLAHEYWRDHTQEPFNGGQPYHRMWVIRRGEKARPVLPKPVSHSGHEWWDPDGRHVWYVHYGAGIKKVSLATGEETMIWRGRHSHGHSDATGRYVVADWMDEPHDPDCHVRFLNTVTGKTVEIVKRPPLAPDLTRSTHLHPHPQFCCQDRYICYTTTINDRVDVALVPVADLVAATQ